MLATQDGQAIPPGNCESQFRRRQIEGCVCSTATTTSALSQAPFLCANCSTPIGEIQKKLFARTEGGPQPATSAAVTSRSTLNDDRQDLMRG